MEDILAQTQKTACPRVNICCEYGQELYHSEISGDETPSKKKVIAIRKKGNKLRAPRFAEWIYIISYNRMLQVSLALKQPQSPNCYRKLERI